MPALSTARRGSAVARKNNPELGHEMDLLQRRHHDRGRYANDPEHRARVLAAVAEYKKRNPEKASAAVRAWHARNIEWRREYKRQWRAKNADKVKASAQRDRVRRRGAADPESRAYAVQISNDPCSYCGEAADHTDHIVAVSNGGGSHWSNLTAACGPCNRRKAKRSVLHFLIAERTA